MTSKIRLNAAAVNNRGKKRSQRGAALIIALLLLLLLTGMTVAMVLSTSSDMMINGYYRNYRGSFYAADSGLTVARQALANKVLADVPATIDVNTSPMPANEATTVHDSILATYGAGSRSMTSGQAG